MPAPQYATAYEFSPFLVAGWPMFLGVPLIMIAAWRASGVTSWKSMVLPLIGIALALVFLGSAAMTSVKYHLETMSAIGERKLSVIDGTITGTHCVGKGRQAFTVGAERFEPSQFGFQPGFQSGAIFSSSVRDGMRVRVHYFDASWGLRVITKLENDATTGILPHGIKLFGPCGN